MTAAVEGLKETVEKLEKMGGLIYEYSVERFRGWLEYDNVRFMGAKVKVVKAD